MPVVARPADVVVVGGSGHGAGVACQLTRWGAARVVLVERKFLASGPTGRSSALVRRFYALDFLTRTANTSADVFQRWGEVIGGGGPGYRPGRGPLRGTPPPGALPPAHRARAPRLGGDARPADP